MFNQQQSMQQSISSKELSYITDSLKNEDLIAKIALQGVSESLNPSLKQKLAQIAQDRLQNSEQMLSILQQHAQLTQ